MLEEAAIAIGSSLMLSLSRSVLLSIPSLLMLLWCLRPVKPISNRHCNEDRLRHALNRRDKNPPLLHPLSSSFVDGAHNLLRGVAILI